MKFIHLFLQYSKMSTLFLSYYAVINWKIVHPKTKSHTKGRRQQVPKPRKRQSTVSRLTTGLLRPGIPDAVHVAVLRRFCRCIKRIVQSWCNVVTRGRPAHGRSAVLVSQEFTLQTTYSRPVNTEFSSDNSLINTSFPHSHCTCTLLIWKPHSVPINLNLSIFYGFSYNNTLIFQKKLMKNNILNLCTCKVRKWR